MRLVHAFNPEAAIERAQDGLARILRLLPPGMQSRVTVDRTKRQRGHAFPVRSGIRPRAPGLCARIRLPARPT